jgi:peptidoglycan/LPS O-acetylase OafA/YrhL
MALPTHRDRQERDDSPGVVVIVALIATLAATDLSWFFIEKPFLRLEDHGVVG